MYPFSKNIRQSTIGNQFLWLVIWRSEYLDYKSMEVWIIYEMERIWEESVLSWWEHYPGISLRETEEDHENPKLW